MPEPMRPAAERIAEKERIELSTISAAEVLAYLAQDCYLNLAQASEYLAISTRTLRDSDAPRYRIGSKMLLFKKSELDEWMIQYREGGDAELDELVDDTLAKVLGD